MTAAIQATERPAGLRQPAARSRSTRRAAWSSARPARRSSSAAEMGSRGAGGRPRPGRRHRHQPAGDRDQRRPRPGPRRRPSGRLHRRPAARVRLQAGAGERRRGRLRPGPPVARALPRPPSTSRASARPRPTPTCGPRSIRLKAGMLRRVDEAPYRALLRRRGQAGDGQLGPVSGARAEARCPASQSQRDGHRRAPRPPRLPGRDDQRLARGARRTGGARAGEGRDPGRRGGHRPPPLHPLRRRRRRRRSPRERARAGSLDRAEFEASVDRVLALRARCSLIV